MPRREPDVNDGRPDPQPADETARIARALRRLPDLDPPTDGWTRIERRLGARPGPPIWVPTAAVAACALLVAVGLLLRPDTTAPPAEGPPTRVSMPRDVAAGAPPGVAEWRSRSVALERLLADLPEPRVARASTALTTTLLEDRIAAIDEQLSDAAGGEAAFDADSLYRERVLLLDSLVRVRYAAAVDPAT